MGGRLICSEANSNKPVWSPLSVTPLGPPFLHPHNPGALVLVNKDPGSDMAQLYYLNSGG